MHWDLQGLTTQRELEIRDCEDVIFDSFPEGLLPSYFNFVQTLESSAPSKPKRECLQNVACLELLLLQFCKELPLLPREVLLPVSLRTLWIYQCPFLERRYQRGKGEDWHNISHIPDIIIHGDTTYALLVTGYRLRRHELLFNFRQLDLVPL
ncbi:hypothetical protein TIFTF001_037690 [Ficus carica]|uniref:Uncharacterized protein n=1 Tax=Ficus carica TaxID=3494 RepID=A0AA88JDU9_FICCA|nr:hypothetical protein TIFTF001_037690 [Ficus carica]